MTFLLSFLNILGILFLIYFSDYKLVEGLNRLDVTKCISLYYFLLFLLLFILIKLILITTFNIKWNISDLRHILVPKYFQKKYFHLDDKRTKLSLAYKVISIIGLLFDLSIFAGVGFLFLKILLIEIQMSLEGTIPLLGFFKYFFPSDQQWFIYKIYTVESKQEFLNKLIQNWNDINKFTLKTLNLKEVYFTKEEINNLLELDSLKAIKVTFKELIDTKMTSYESYNNFYSKFLNLTGFEFSQVVTYSLLALVLTSCFIGVIYFNLENSYKKIAELRQQELDQRGKDLHKYVGEINTNVDGVTRNTSALLEGMELSKRCIDNNSRNIELLHNDVVNTQETFKRFFRAIKRQQEVHLSDQNKRIRENLTAIRNNTRERHYFYNNLPFLNDREEVKLVKKEIEGLVKVAKILKDEKKTTTVSEMIWEAVKEQK